MSQKTFKILSNFRMKNPNSTFWKNEQMTSDISDSGTQIRGRRAMIESQKIDQPWGVRGIFEKWNIGNAISCDLVIKFYLQFW